MLPRLLQRAIARPAFDFATASAPAEGIELGRSGQFDLILCDYDLRAPQTGIDVLRAVGNERALRVLITGHSPRELPADREGSYDAFLEKPMTLRDVVAPLAEILRERLGVPVDLTAAG